MTAALPFGLDLPTTDSIGQWVLRILAVAGAAAIGGFATGLITQGLSRLLTTRPVPRVPLRIVRVLGAIVCGWVVALLLIGGVGSGGGGGLWPFGGGGPGGGSGKQAPAASDRVGGAGREGGPRDTARGEGRTLVVEVLPEYPAVYRIQTAGGPRTFKFEELTSYLLEQKTAMRPLTGIRVSAERSDLNAPAVTRLTEWARKHGLMPPNVAP
jgi:hypothetical protein